MFNKGQLAGLMKQAQAMQEKMQQQMTKVNEELAAMEIDGQAGAGMVKVVMSGNYSVKRVVIDPSLMVGDDREMLEDLIAAACNDASRKVATVSEEKKGAMSAGMGMPAGFKMPF